MSTDIQKLSKRAREAAVRLCRWPGLKHLHPDDVQQELLVKVLQARKRYVRERGAEESFLECVLRDAMLEIRRRERGPRARAERQRRRYRPGLHERSHVSGVPEVDLRLDVQSSLTDLPEEAAEVVRLLATNTISQSTRVLGKRRSAVRTLARQLKGRFGKEFF